MVTVCTASLSFNNSTFCPHTVFMCFVWISEQTAIISLYNINWLVFISETQCVYCAVRTKYFYAVQVNLSFYTRMFKPAAFTFFSRVSEWVNECVFVQQFNLLTAGFKESFSAEFHTKTDRQTDSWYCWTAGWGCNDPHYSSLVGWVSDPLGPVRLSLQSANI